jgi:hypothetical protein
VTVRNDRGTVTAFVASFTVAMLAVAGLVADGGFMLAARRAAFNEADAAARAGAQAIDESVLRSSGEVRVDPVAARHRVEDLLESTGHDVAVDVAGGEVIVTVRFDKQLALLGIVGLGPVEIEATGSARAVRGVQTGDD